MWMLLVTLSLAAAGGEVPQESGEATRAVVEFQRAVDRYAFARRQVAHQHAAPPAREGDLFSPMIADVLRHRIERALHSGCALPVRPESFVVPRVNSKAGDAPALVPCIARTLPALPAELQYRAAGTALLLVDAAAGTVVDVLHGAFQYDR
jgi:hypothetical protein